MSELVHIRSTDAERDAARLVWLEAAPVDLDRMDTSIESRVNFNTEVGCKHHFITQTLDAIGGYGRFLVAERDDQMLGFLQGYVYRPAHRDAHVGWLYVGETVRGQRIGQQLMEHFEGMVEPTVPITLGVVHNNMPARTLYSRLGYRPVNRLQTVWIKQRRKQSA